MRARPRTILGELTHHFGGAGVGVGTFCVCSTFWCGESKANKAEYEYACEK
jgi:hypothetical protein